MGRGNSHAFAMCLRHAGDYECNVLRADKAPYFLFVAMCCNQICGAVPATPEAFKYVLNGEEQQPQSGRIINFTIFPSS